MAGKSKSKLLGDMFTSSSLEDTGFGATWNSGFEF